MVELLEFGTFSLDVRNGSLLRDGLAVPIGYRAMLLLAEFARQSGPLARLADKDDAKADVVRYIERFYNPKRRRSTIGYPRPLHARSRLYISCTLTVYVGRMYINAHYPPPPNLDGFEGCFAVGQNSSGKATHHQE